MVSLTLSEGCLGRVLIQAIHPLTYTRVVCTWNALLSRRSPSPPSPAWFLHGPRRKSPSVSYPCHRALHDTEYASGPLSIRTLSIFGLLSALRLLVAFEWCLKRTSTAVRLSSPMFRTSHVTHHLQPFFASHPHHPTRHTTREPWEPDGTFASGR